MSDDESVAHALELVPTRLRETEEEILAREAFNGHIASQRLQKGVGLALFIVSCRRQDLKAGAEDRRIFLAHSGMSELA